jgi:hypothetical protein
MSIPQMVFNQKRWSNKRELADKLTIAQMMELQVCQTSGF